MPRSNRTNFENGCIHQQNRSRWTFSCVPDCGPPSMGKPMGKYSTNHEPRTTNHDSLLTPKPSEPGGTRLLLARGNSPERRLLCFPFGSPTNISLLVCRIVGAREWPVEPLRCKTAGSKLSKEGSPEGTLDSPEHSWFVLCCRDLRGFQHHQSSQGTMMVLQVFVPISLSMITFEQEALLKLSGIAETVRSKQGINLHEEPLSCSSSTNSTEP